MGFCSDQPRAAELKLVRNRAAAQEKCGITALAAVLVPTDGFLVVVSLGVGVVATGNRVFG